MKKNVVLTAGIREEMVHKSFFIALFPTIECFVQMQSGFSDTASSCLFWNKKCLFTDVVQTLKIK